MNEKDTLLDEISKLYAIIRRISGLIPEDHFDWKVHGVESSRVFDEIKFECTKAGVLPQNAEPKVDCDSCGGAGLK